MEKYWFLKIVALKAWKLSPSDEVTLICHLLMEKLWNIGWFSNHLGTNKDASYHLRLCLADLGEKWGHNR